MSAPLKQYSPSSRRELSEMDLLASPSRSGGHAANEDALLSFETQERFRAYIEDKLDSLRNRSADVLTDEYDQVLSISHEKDAYYFLLDILLLFRKLREGVVASKRQDLFAVEVYETASRFALKIANFTHLLPCLSGLVRELYPALDRSSPDHAITADLQRLSINSTRGSYIPPHQRAARNAPISSSPPPPKYALKKDNRQLFIPIYLLLQLVHFQSTILFVDLLGEVTGSSSALYPKAAHASIPSTTSGTPPRKGKEPVNPIIAPSHACLNLPRRIYRSTTRSDTLLVPQLLSSKPPIPIHPLERLTLLFNLPQTQRSTWRVLKAAYRDFGEKELGWLEGVLGVRSGQGVAWLDEKGCVKSETGRWSLKSGRE